MAHGAALIEHQEKYRREFDWHRIETTIGPRYRNAMLKTWRYHGTNAEQTAQQAMMRRIAKISHVFRESPSTAPNCLFYGPPGSGKDHIGTALLRIAVLEGGATGMWSNGLDLFGAMRDLMGSSESEREFLERYTEPVVLLLSDPLPPVGALSEYQNAMLLRLIDGRYRQQRPTLVTLNADSRKEAEARMSVPLISRLTHGATAIHFNWGDFRERTR